MEEARYTRDLALLGLAACVFLGALVSYLFIVKNYNPLRNIVKSFEGKMKLSFDRRINEYNFIQQAINETFDEKEKISSLAAQQSKQLKSAFLAGLLKGRATEVPLHELLTSYEIRFESNFFSVLVFFIEDVGRFQSDKEQEAVTRTGLAQFVIGNVVEELANRKSSGFVTEVDDMLACIVNFKEEQVKCWKQELLQIMD